MRIGFVVVEIRAIGSICICIFFFFIARNIDYARWKDRSDHVVVSVISNSWYKWNIRYDAESPETTILSNVLAFDDENVSLMFAYWT